jgi:3-methyl-2-oxobutanoate hydroxymethyltransferase
MSHSLSDESKPKALTVPDIRAMKGRQKIASITCYDASFARIIDRTPIHLVLVGDSATLPLTMEEMLMLTRAVCSGLTRPFLVADMPFLSYQPSEEVAITNAGLFLKAGAKAVKVEGAGSHILKIVARLVEIGIPVMGHLGLTPQSVHSLGGYKLQGKEDADAERILAEARLLEQAGCFSIVLEKITSSLAGQITQSLSIPTIGIGAGPACDGQILVLYDLLGLDSSFKPRFVRRYADLEHTVHDALSSYVEDVINGSFPNEEESFH